MRIAYLCINQYSKSARHEGAGELGTRGAHTGCQTADDVQCIYHLRQTHKDSTLSPSPSSIIISLTYDGKCNSKIPQDYCFPSLMQRPPSYTFHVHAHTLIGIALLQGSSPAFQWEKRGSVARQENKVCTGSREVQSVMKSDATLAKCYVRHETKLSILDHV